MTVEKRLPRSVRPGIVEQMNAVLDGRGDYDESIQARLHMVGTSLEGTGLELVDALGGYAVAGTNHLGVLAGPTRWRLEAICGTIGPLDVVDVAQRYGFATTRREVLDVAAYQVRRCADEDVLRSRLQYLYGAARADLDLELDSRHFAKGVASRLRREDPDRWALPARVRAAEYKTDPDLDPTEAPRDVQRILAIDPDVSESGWKSPRRPFEEPSDVDPGPTERVEATGIEFWGCPFCEYTDTLRRVARHVSDPDGPHGHRTARHVPGYDETGTLRAVLPAGAEVTAPAVRADTAPVERWTTPEQREAARLGVPLWTAHNGDCGSVLAVADLAAATDSATASTHIELDDAPSQTAAPNASGSTSETFDWLSES